jgi:hypothetical protein
VVRSVRVGSLGCRITLFKERAAARNVPGFAGGRGGFQVAAAALCGTLQHLVKALVLARTKRLQVGFSSVKPT